ncbi:MAG: sporulation initiation factor Spo0A C-terminal domain-containing protein [Firmicutes bacterium]|nr:sporulation initiation factor Spo0A C-terminal domain-containing protein [Bacillota bacterium]
MESITGIIQQIAKENNTTPESVIYDMECAIDHAWQTNSNIREMFTQKPTYKEFIQKLADVVSMYDK